MKFKAGDIVRCVNVSGMANMNCAGFLKEWYLYRVSECRFGGFSFEVQCILTGEKSNMPFSGFRFVRATPHDLALLAIQQEAAE